MDGFWLPAPFRQQLTGPYATLSYRDGQPAAPDDARAVHARYPLLQPAQWRLLLQIDSEHDIALGDSGQIQVVIRESDLRARRFERARIVFQCC